MGTALISSNYPSKGENLGPETPKKEYRLEIERRWKASTSPRRQQMPGSLQGLKQLGRKVPKSLGSETLLLTPGFQIAGLRNCTRRTLLGQASVLVTICCSGPGKEKS